MKTNVQARPAEIASKYSALIDAHLTDLLNYKTDKMLEIEDFAQMLFIHPTHLSTTIKDVTGQSACGVYQIKILDTAKDLLADSQLTIRSIALLLTYEPSQFTNGLKG